MPPRRQNASRCSPTMRMAGARSRPRSAPDCRSRRSIDARPDVSPAHRSLASKNGFTVLHGSVSGVDGGKDGVRKIAVSLTGGARAEVEADGLAVSGGWNPAVGLTSYHRGRPKWRDDIAAFVPDGAPPGMVAAGAANGAFGLGACLSQGFAAGAAAARDAGRSGKRRHRRRSPTTRRSRSPRSGMSPARARPSSTSSTTSPLPTSNWRSAKVLNRSSI